MKIPGLDTLAYRTFWALDRLGRIRTIRDMARPRLEVASGLQERT